MTPAKVDAAVPLFVRPGVREGRTILPLPVPERTPTVCAVFPRLITPGPLTVKFAPGDKETPGPKTNVPPVTVVVPLYPVLFVNVSIPVPARVNPPPVTLVMAPL